MLLFVPDSLRVFAENDTPHEADYQSVDLWVGPVAREVVEMLVKVVHGCPLAHMLAGVLQYENQVNECMETRNESVHLP